ncbi:MAG: hypothetical protein V1696_01840 [Candidatus Jorgensenbacteria bacterium]
MDTEQQKFIDFLIKERDETTSLRGEINKGFNEVRLKLAEQRWEFFKHVTILSGAVLGLSSLVKTPQNSYFVIGVILNIAVIVFCLLVVRETLDKESNGLQKMQDDYNSILDGKVSFIDERFVEIGNGMGISDYTVAVKDFITNIAALPGAQKIKKDNEQLKEDRKLRFYKPMDYSGELALFLFVLASYFLAISIFNLQPTWWVNILAVLLMGVTTLFFDAASKISSFVSIRLHNTKNQFKKLRK